MNSIVLDPGIRVCGASLLQEKELIGASNVWNPRESGDGPEEWVSMARSIVNWIHNCKDFKGRDFRLVVEVPRVRQAGFQKGDPNDLIPLAGIGGALASWDFISERVRYFPEDWKGQTNKQDCLVMIRVKQRLTKAEFANIEFPKNTCDACQDQSSFSRCLRVLAAEAKGRTDGKPCPIHNAYDSIGLALKSVGRFEKKRVIAR